MTACVDTQSDEYLLCVTRPLESIEAHRISLTTHMVVSEIHADMVRLNGSSAQTSKGVQLLLLGNFIAAEKHASSPSDEAVAIVCFCAKREALYFSA